MTGNYTNVSSIFHNMRENASFLSKIITLSFINYRENNINNNKQIKVLTKKECADNISRQETENYYTVHTK